MASQIPGVSIVCSIVGSGADQRKHRSSVSVPFVQGINSPATGEFPAQKPVTRKMFPFDDVIMKTGFMRHYPLESHRIKLKKHEHDPSSTHNITPNKIRQQNHIHRFGHTVNRIL